MVNGAGVTGEIIDMGFQKKVAAAVKAVGDLRPAFLAITSDWYKDNAQIFKFQTTMGYPPLKPKTIASKVRRALKLGIPMSSNGLPMLKFTGALMRSITIPNEDYAVYEITKTNLTLGSAIPYGIYHQSAAARSKIPYRPFIINSTVKTGTNIFEGRVKRYTRTIETFVARRVALATGGK